MSGLLSRRGPRALGIDDEQGAIALAVLRSIDAIGARDRALGLEIREQRKMKSPITGEGGMAPCPVHGDPEQRRAVLVKLGEDLVVKAHLITTYRAPVGRIERQDHRATPKVRQRETLVRRALEAEVGRHRTLAEGPG